MDLSTNLWSYKVGLNGERKRLYDSKSHVGVSWNTNSPHIPIGKPMTWYKAEFKAPLEETLLWWTSKAWVKDMLGKSATPIVEVHRKGGYHVPRSFLNDDMNTLVLFEEIGGNPQNVQFQTVTTGIICANVHEGAQLELSCQNGQVISQIQFASFGSPQGQCGSFKKGSWEATNSKSVVEASCIGKSNCGFIVTKEMFSVPLGVTNSIARLAVQVTC
ncbi:unnamed protein product [Vicia faba]|uniref:SUEL-type lectin domain-containing protein n=1 Tax=Vicia faba TaxID=3906 RepID=A0AAV0YPY7_VICFA|nr:unnamed protein product [Vicia faba]